MKTVWEAALHVVGGFRRAAMMLMACEVMCSEFSVSSTFKSHFLQSKRSHIHALKSHWYIKSCSLIMRPFPCSFLSGNNFLVGWFNAITGRLSCHSFRDICELQFSCGS